MNRIRWRKVLAIATAWTLLGAGLVVHDHLAFLAFEGTLPEYGFGRSLVSTIAAAAIGGAISATLVVFLIKPRLRTRSFAAVVTAHTVTYVGITAALALVGAFAYAASALSRPVWDPATRSTATELFLGPFTLKALLFWTVAAALTSFLVEIFDVLGPGFARDFVLGRYHQPKTERRCFMFLDLRSSTGIAERLGHEGYYRLLNDFYADMTEAITDTRGQIYQYVGDEVVVSWKGDDGVDDAACVRCFFMVRRGIDRHADRYRSRYGLVPEFKASFHIGEVTAGEIGRLKRDIVFTGDVLNTASRIQERCNHHGVDTLLSEDLVALLPQDAGFRVVPVEEIELRGKAARTVLYTVTASAGVDRTGEEHVPWRTA